MFKKCQSADHHLVSTSPSTSLLILEIPRIRYSSSYPEFIKVKFTMNSTIKLTEKQKDALLAEVGYTRKQLDSDLQQIKDWLKLQHHLPPCRLQEDDSFLTTFLTGCKGSLEKTKRKLDAYYTLRSHSELFDSRDPLDPGYVKMGELVNFTITPAITESRSMLLLYSSLTDADQADFDFLPYLRIFISRIELHLRGLSYSPRAILLADFRKTTISQHLRKVKPLLLKDFVYFVLEVLPFRVAKLIFINSVPFLSNFMNTAVIPFVPRKMKDRFHFTANGIEEVMQEFDTAFLPDIYGGDFPLRQANETWIEEIIKRRDWYLNELSQRCDESKRIVHEDPTNPYFGVPGSLKKLEVD